MDEEELAWYENPKNEHLYIGNATKGMRGYHAPITSPKITFVGTNSLSDFGNFVGNYFPDEEKRILLVVDKDLRKMGVKTGNWLKNIKGFDYEIFDNVLSDAPKDTLMDGVRICDEFKPKMIIAIGGGSAIDTAKGIFLLYERPEINYKQLMVPSYLGLRKKVDFLVAIPTTAGTGSEATTTSVITETDRNPPKKAFITLYELCPDIAVLHTDYVETMPPFLTAATGLDALAHSMGTYMLNLSNEYMDMHNLKAIELVLKYLPRAVKRGKDLEAREKMQIAAYMAGIGFSLASTNIDHGLGQSFGAIFHAHHGLMVGIFLGASVAFQSKVNNRIIELAKIFEIKTDNKLKDQILRELLEKLQSFMKSINIPISISEIEKPKVTREEYDEKMDILVEYAYTDATRLFSSRKITRAKIRKMFEASFEAKIDDIMDLYYN